MNTPLTKQRIAKAAAELDKRLEQIDKTLQTTLQGGHKSAYWAASSAREAVRLEAEASILSDARSTLAWGEEEGQTISNEQVVWTVLEAVSRPLSGSNGHLEAQHDGRSDAAKRIIRLFPIADEA